MRVLSDATLFAFACAIAVSSVGFAGVSSSHVNLDADSLTWGTPTAVGDPSLPYDPIANTNYYKQTITGATSSFIAGQSGASSPLYGAPAVDVGNNTLISATSYSNPDPFLGLNYSIENTASVPQTYTITRTLPASPALAAPTQYLGSVSVTLTDGHFSGSAPVIDDSNLYTAKIDGVSYLTLDPALAGVAYGTTSTSLPAGVPTFTFGGPALNSDISITLTFTLSPGDLASITSNFIVIPQSVGATPEPTSLAILGLGAIGLLKRRNSRA